MSQETTLTKLTVPIVVFAIATSPALAQRAQRPCDVANGAVRLQMTSQACMRPLNNQGKKALGLAQTNSAVMGCLESQFNKVQAELKDIRTLGGAVGVSLQFVAGPDACGFLVRWGTVRVDS